MAQRHNEYSQLLGTVENGVLPMADVPNLTAMGDMVEADAQMHAANMKAHADRLRQMGQMQPCFGDLGGENG